METGSGSSVTATGGSTSGTTDGDSTAAGGTAGAGSSGGSNERRARRMMGRSRSIVAGAARTQMALLPMATCFQFVPSEMARHGTLPVPPADKWMMRRGNFAAVTPAATAAATLVKVGG